MSTGSDTEPTGAGRSSDTIHIDDPVMIALLGALVGVLLVAAWQRTVVALVAGGLLLVATLLHALLRTGQANRDAEHARSSEIRAQERRFASLVLNASDAVAVVDEDGVIRYMSPPIENILGWTAEEMIGRPSHEFVHPDDLERCIETWEEILVHPGGMARVDVRHQTRDGQWRLIEGTFANLLHDPEVGGVVVNERDVTERRAAEDALSDKAAREETINHLGRHALEAVDLAILAAEATELARPGLRGSAATFVRVLPDDAHVVIQCRSGDLTADLEPRPIADGRSIEAEALRTGAPVAVSTFVVDHGFVPLAIAGDGPCGAICVPVPGRHGPYGALTIYRDAGDRFSAEEMGFLRSLVGVLSLAVQRQGAEDEIRLQALHDSLTGLPNRALFLDRVRSALGRAQRHDRSLGVLIVDLDRFKDVNDGVGHGIGDQVLVEVGQRLVASLRPGDTVARMDGDAFTLLCENLDRDDELEEVAARVAAAVARPLAIAGTELRLTASIGIQQGWGREGAEQLIGDADAAMYRAKQRGRARTERFDPTMRTRMVDRLQVGPHLQRAMAQGELHMAYQPVIDLTSGATVAIEALLRWDDPERGAVPPCEFIPLAEESGYIHELGRWVLEEAISEVRRWGGADPGLTVAVNVSPVQLVHADFADVVAEMLTTSGLRPERLSLEVTEGAFEQDIEVIGDSLQALRELGVTTAIDDFGTGYSSIAYLKRLPVDVLKLDASFVANLATSREDLAIAEAVATFGRSLGLTTVAEGVETEEQASTVQAIGYDRAQGYLYCRPVPLAQIPRVGPTIDLREAAERAG
jgi:diguanylate cyclase (GGDEF)-like protein/PAS domain S-box-containing protein